MKQWLSLTVITKIETGSTEFEPLVPNLLFGIARTTVTNQPACPQRGEDIHSKQAGLAQAGRFVTREIFNRHNRIQFFCMKKILRLTVISLLIITAINAVVAGFLFITDPSGRKLGMSVEYLNFSPFNSYLIPGIVLLVVNGLLNFAAAYAVIKNKAYSSVFVIIQGILLGGWILIQVIMVRDVSILHIIMFSVGLVFTLSGLLLWRMSKENPASC